MEKWLVFDGCMGAAGDMLSASLLSLFDKPQKMVQELNELGIPGVVYQLEKTKKQGMEGYLMHVLVDGEEEKPSQQSHEQEIDHFHDHAHHDHVHPDHHEHHEPDHNHDHSFPVPGHDQAHDHGHDHDHEQEDPHHHHHHHTGMAEISQIISQLNTSEQIKEKIRNVFGKLARAESQVHGTEIDQIHFHEVGQMDALADIAAVCILIDRLGVDRIFCTPIHVGSGMVHCAHGWLPVPAPATALLLEGIPIYSTDLEGELCTPTGAALLSYFVDEFRPLPLMVTEKTGAGFGQKEFGKGHVNLLRSYLARPFKDKEKDEQQEKSEQEIFELSCNLDDSTGEQIGYAFERLFEKGALDVYTTSIGMKKSRPGIKLSVLCKKEQKDDLIQTLFKETSTLGIRELSFQRYELERQIEQIQSEEFDYALKKARGYGIEKEKIEYEDLARLAKEMDLSLEEMRRIIEKSKY